MLRSWCNKNKHNSVFYYNAKSLEHHAFDSIEKIPRCDAYKLFHFDGCPCDTHRDGALYLVSFIGITTNFRTQFILFTPEPVSTKETGSYGVTLLLLLSEILP